MLKSNSSYKAGIELMIARPSETDSLCQDELDWTPTAGISRDEPEMLMHHKLGKLICSNLIRTIISATSGSSDPSNRRPVPR